MNIKVKDLIIKIIYFLIIIFIYFKMYGTYSAINFFNSGSNIISLIVIILCFLYFLFDILNGKIKINNFSIVLILLLLYEFVIIILRDTFVFPYYIIDTLLWPMLLLVFMDYTSNKNFPKLISKSAFYIYICIIILSILLVIKHHNYGNYGEYIFKAYFTLSFLPLVLKIEKNDTKKNLSIILSIIIIAFSAKRAGMIALIFGTFLYYITDAYIQSNLNTKYKKYIKLVLITIIAIISLFYLIDNSNIEIINRFKNLSNDGGSGRNEIWDLIYNEFENSSFQYKILGYGFQSVYYKLKPFGFNRLAHNSYLEYLYDYGIIGLTLLILFFLKIIKYTINCFKKKNKNTPSLSFSIILSLILSVFSYYFEQSLIIIPIAILWGICIGESCRIKGERK